MIIRDKPSAWHLLFLLKGSVVPTILPQIVVIALFSVAVKYLDYAGYIDLSAVTMTPFSVFGIALSLFLGFRNNAAYDRWWEARRHWGQLVYDVRSLGRSTEILIGVDHPERKGLLNEVLAFSHFLRGSLRKTSATRDAARFIGDDLADQAAATANPADFIMRQMGKRLGTLYRSGDLDSVGVRILDERLTSMAAVQAANERIANTPLPFAYSLLVHRTAYLYCFLLPFGLASSVGWFAPLFSVVVAYVFFGLDALSAELETPYGCDQNGLPLDAMCRVNEISVAEALNETPPEPLKPTDYKLT
jgi:putative membrane protein